MKQAIKVIQTFPTVQIELDDGTLFEFAGDTLSIYQAGDTPGMAEPLNAYYLEDMYKPA